MKQFWLKLSLRTKIIFFVFLIVIFLSFLGRINYKAPENNTIDNSSFINKITDRDLVLSYPASYTAAWDGRIKLVPVNSRELEYTVSSTKECNGITNKMDVYYTSDVASIMVINNYNLMISQNEKFNFEEAKAIITGEKDIDSLNVELQTFRTYCSYFSLYPFEELDTKMPNVDASKAFIGIGLRQGIADDVSKLGLYIYVYGSKDDYLVQLSRSLQGSFLFSENNWDSCKNKSLQSEQNACLKQIYLNDKSMQSKVNFEVQNLITTFELNGN